MLTKFKCLTVAIAAAHQEYLVRRSVLLHHSRFLENFYASGKASDAEPVLS